MSGAPRLAFLAGLCWALAAGLAVLVIRQNEWLVSSDYRLGRNIFTFARENPAVLQVLRLWNAVGGPLISTIVVVIVVAVLLLKRYRGWALFLAVCSLGGVLINEVIKGLVDRTRPSWPDPFITAQGSSFPSGHSAAGIFAWAVLGLVAMYLVRGSTGLIVGWALVIFGVLQAPSRVVLGVHWVSDVVTGQLVAMGWVLIVSAASLWLVGHSTRGGADAQARVSPGAEGATT